MEWLYCEDCGAVFMDEDACYRRIEERHFWLDDCPTEVLYERYCPECGSGDLNEADYCEMCGEPARPQDLIDGLCEKCRKEEQS